MASLHTLPLPSPNIIEFNPLYKLNITSIGEARKEERFNQKKPDIFEINLKSVLEREWDILQS